MLKYEGTYSVYLLELDGLDMVARVSSTEAHYGFILT